MPDPGRVGIPPIGEHVVARTDRKLFERLARPAPFRPGQLEEITAQRRQPDAVMEPPQRSGPSRLLYRRGVEDPHLESSVRGDGDAVFLKQFHAQRIEPVPRFPEPLQQRHVRQIRQARLPSPHHGLSQRMSASQMDQQRPQQLLRRLVLAQPSQRPRLRRQILPVVRKERDQQVPVLACRPLHHGSAHASTIQNYDAEDKLALMGVGRTYRLGGIDGGSSPAPPVYAVLA